MKRIDEYVNNIYKGFDESDEETQILIEETKSHLYDEVEDLKSQGFSEEESIKKAIYSFGKEKAVINELKGILKKQDRFSKIILKIALIVFSVGLVLKAILFGIDISGIYNNRHEEYLSDNSCSYYVFDTLEEKLKDKDSIDDNLKYEINKFLDEFNERTNDGMFHMYLIKNGEYVYEYSREGVDKQIAEESGGGMSNLKNGWSTQYSSTDNQRDYDYALSQKEWEPYEKMNVVNNLANYSVVLSWIMACISFVYKIYIKNKINKKNIAYFSISTILVVGLVATGVHTLEESTIFLIVALLVISTAYNRKYIEIKQY